ncbi:MAG TPA: DUF4465 domain-containing protein [Tepidisphaeraceae bacterium]|nr:DUF4465 domain-containing protein [Tepidisphaeraceae bacterium]
MFRFLTLLIAILIAPFASADVINFEDNILAPNSYYDGADHAGGFTSGGAFFANSNDSGFWAGFAYSNVNNTTTAGPGNQYAAIPGTGAGGSGNYAVGFDGGGFGASAEITLPYAAHLQSIDVTNTTYAFLAVRDGNDNGGSGPSFVREFGTTAKGDHGNAGVPDLFTLIITGRDGLGNIVGSVNFQMADYTFANNADDYVVNNWRTVDLSSLDNVKTLAFTMTTTDMSFGFPNTPTYFALDNVTFVPEPQCIGPLMYFFVVYLARREYTPGPVVPSPRAQ